MAKNKQDLAQVEFLKFESTFKFTWGVSACWHLVEETSLGPEEGVGRKLKQICLEKTSYSVNRILKKFLKQEIILGQQLTEFLANCLRSNIYILWAFEINSNVIWRQEFFTRIWQKKTPKGSFVRKRSMIGHLIKYVCIPIQVYERGGAEKLLTPSKKRSKNKFDYLRYLHLEHWLHLCCHYQNVSDDVLSSLPQVYIDRENIQGILNWILYLIYGVDFCSTSHV